MRYIICIYRLSEGRFGVKNIELANALGFSRPSVHNMLRSLAELGVIYREHLGLAVLTDEGRVLAQKYACCYDLLERQMTEIYGRGAVSENAICGLLTDMPSEKIDELYNGSKK